MERRKSPRYPLSAAVYVTGRDRVVIGHTVDVGPEGIGVVVPSMVVLPGDELRLRLIVPGGALETRGLVRSSALLPTLRRRIGLQLRFATVEEQLTWQRRIVAPLQESAVASASTA